MNRGLNKNQHVWIYRMSVITLGLVILASIVGAIISKICMGVLSTDNAQ